MVSSPRPTLSADDLLRHAGDLPWRDLRVLVATGSTNADVLAAAQEGAPEGLVIAADEQTAGRGRLGRDWVSPPGASISVSVLLRPALDPGQWGWLPLLTGLSVAAGVAETAGLDVDLKWPNDVLVAQGRPGKIAGVLLERSGDAAVVGFGINTAMTAEELPVEQASSIVLAGAAAPDPAALAAACLRNLYSRYDRLRAGAGDPDRSGLAAEYAQRCATIGRHVQVSMPDGRVLAGTAAAVDSSGRLVVEGPDGATSISAGDVTHVR
jgi:BirA family transcriptional regulator, biotin operon repressor / biotin---[acetyl-CoA-carboxylase] ligase